MPSSPRGEHAAAAMKYDFEAYEPMKRWKDEEFQEQPWQGIYRPHRRTLSIRHERRQVRDASQGEQPVSILSGT